MNKTSFVSKSLGCRTALIFCVSLVFLFANRVQAQDQDSRRVAGAMMYLQQAYQCAQAGNQVCTTQNVLAALQLVPELANEPVTQEVLRRLGVAPSSPPAQPTTVPRAPIYDRDGSRGDPYGVVRRGAGSDLSTLIRRDREINQSIRSR